MWVSVFILKFDIEPSYQDSHRHTKDHSWSLHSMQRPRRLHWPSHFQTFRSSCHWNEDLSCHLPLQASNSPVSFRPYDRKGSWWIHRQPGWFHHLERRHLRSWRSLPLWFRWGLMRKIELNSKSLMKASLLRRRVLGFNCQALIAICPVRPNLISR